MMRWIHYILFVAVLAFSSLTVSTKAFACGCPDCCGAIAGCASCCAKTSQLQTPLTIDHITNTFLWQRHWLIEIFFRDERPGTGIRDTDPGILAAMMIMTTQLNA